MKMQQNPSADRLVDDLYRRIQDRSLTPTSTLVDLMTANSVVKAGKMSRSEQESSVREYLQLIDYTTHLPQPILLTKSFLEDVLDPLMMVKVPTARYRVTMRKLLRLTSSQLRQQAELMELDILDYDEEDIAALILVNMNDQTKLIQPLVHMLLAKEIAFVYGIRFQVPLRGPAHPSSTVMFTVKPSDMVSNLELTKDDLLDECQNQSIAVNRKENKRQLAVRLIVWWTAHPDQMREPFTPGFARFLLETATRRGR